MRIDEAEARNTAARKKVENVGRPQDDNKDPETSKLAKQGEIKKKIIDEGHNVHVDDGRNYGSRPHDKDAAHVKAGVEKHGGEFAGHTDKGVNFKFKSLGAANSFRKHVSNAPHKTMHADEPSYYDESYIDEGNAENKEKKNVAAADLGSKNRDEKWNDKIRPDVADKMRGREKMKEEVEIEEGNIPDDYGRKLTPSDTRTLSSIHAMMQKERDNKAKKDQEKKLKKEEVEISEISRALASRYINRTRGDDKRKAGNELALKKKWGDKKYGLPEPRVKATEEFEIDESALYGKSEGKTASGTRYSDGKVAVSVHHGGKQIDVFSGSERHVSKRLKQEHNMHMHDVDMKNAADMKEDINHIDEAKEANANLDDKEAKTIKGGVTPVELHPKTDDRPEEQVEDEKSKKAANKANKEIGAKSGKLKEEKWIQKAIKHKGALHKQLHVPADEPIPAEKLNAAAEKGDKLGQRARLAKTLKRIVKEK
jgi:hypothetical protein